MPVIPAAQVTVAAVAGGSGGSLDKTRGGIADSMTVRMTDAAVQVRLVMA